MTGKKKERKKRKEIKAEAQHSHVKVEEELQLGRCADGRIVITPVQECLISMGCVVCMPPLALIDDDYE